MVDDGALSAHEAVMLHYAPFLFGLVSALWVLAGCASTPATPVVLDPKAEPLVRSDVEGFEECLTDAESSFSAAVEIELETDAFGFVEKPQIVRSANPCFNGPALRAVKTWRYPPKMVDGVLARRRGVRVIFVFGFDKDEAS